jgi:TonB family protein
MKQNDQAGGRWHRALRLFVFCLIVAVSASGQESRKLIVQTDPVYPDIARHARLRGTVKVVVVIAPDGQVKDVRVIGGHPLFVDATVEALKKWKYAPSNNETTEALVFNFHP